MKYLEVNTIWCYWCPHFYDSTALEKVQFKEGYRLNSTKTVGRNKSRKKHTSLVVLMSVAAGQRKGKQFPQK